MSEKDALRARAAALHQDSLVIDLHTDALYEHIQGRKDITRRSHVLQTDIPRLIQGRVNAEVFAIWVNPKKYGPAERKPFVLRAIDTYRAILDQNRASIAPALEPGSVRRIAESGRVAGILAVEGGHALEDGVSSLYDFFGRGVRLLTLTWNNSNPLGRSCMAKDGKRHGLTRLGIQAVREMNRLGMVIDLSHSSDKTFWDVLDCSAAPVVCSHSACRALRDFPRNLTDEQLRALGRQRGLIGIVFLPYFICDENTRASLEHVLDHIEHAVSVAGIEAVGIGSDFDGFSDPPPQGLEDATRFPAITEGLLRRGFPAADIRKVLAENFLRVWSEVDQAAG